MVTGLFNSVIHLLKSRSGILQRTRLSAPSASRSTIPNQTCTSTLIRPICPASKLMQVPDTHPLVRAEREPLYRESLVAAHHAQQLIGQHVQDAHRAVAAARQHGVVVVRHQCRHLPHGTKTCSVGGASIGTRIRAVRNMSCSVEGTSHGTGTQAVLQFPTEADLQHRTAGVNSQRRQPSQKRNQAGAV